jgi:hypothetical protein
VGGRAAHAILHELSESERRLLRSLYLDPAPLLALDTHEGRMASWILMRLASFPDPPDQQAARQEEMEPVVVADPGPAV